MEISKLHQCSVCIKKVFLAKKDLLDLKISTKGVSSNYLPKLTLSVMTLLQRKPTVMLRPTQTLRREEDTKLKRENLRKPQAALLLTIRVFLGWT